MDDRETVRRELGFELLHSPEASRARERAESTGRGGERPPAETAAPPRPASAPNGDDDEIPW